MDCKQYPPCGEQGNEFVGKALTAKSGNYEEEKNKTGEDGAIE